MPTAGRVGSWLGLKPYSSTSFLRSSSLFWRALRFLHKKIPASSSSAMATTGTTTAIAILPPELSPFWSSPLFWGLGLAGLGLETAVGGGGGGRAPVGPL